MHQGDEPVDGEQHPPVGGNAGALARLRAIRDHLTPILDDLNPGIVAPEIQAAHFELKPMMFNMLNSIGQFGGSPHEDARQHIRAFLEVCDSFRQQGVHEDVLKLKLFPYSLRDRARAWLSGVPAGSLESWADDVITTTRRTLFSATFLRPFDRGKLFTFEKLQEAYSSLVWVVQAKVRFMKVYFNPKEEPPPTLKNLQGQILREFLLIPSFTCA
ncbi:hypothetical protein GQ457_06G014950 [Hibiscus cannabinus]